MNSKERVKIALSHYQADRVPIDYWAETIITEKLMTRLGIDTKEKLLEVLDIDIRFIEGAVYDGPVLKTFEDSSKEDIWGVRRKKLFIDSNNPGKGSYENVVTYPLAKAVSVKEIEEYQGWPSVDWYDFSHVEEQCDQHSKFAVICGGDRLNRTAQLKAAMYLRGIEQIMIDLALNEKIVEVIFERLVNFYLEFNRRIFERSNGKIDIFFMGDDFGTQNGLLMSKKMWRQFIKPGFTKFIELAHSFGIKVMHHTCGAIEELIPEFIDCGLDILQSLQPGAKGMDLNIIKKKYGQYICFHGGIDIQNTMPYGSPADVENEVKNRLQTLAPGGGYILCTAHNMQADVPVENVLALFEAAKKYGGR